MTSFGIDMGDATEDMGWISEADVAQALSTAGGNLLELHIMWPRVRTLWLNEVRDAFSISRCTLTRCWDG